MSVDGVVLSLGESSLEEANRSLLEQSVRLRQIIQVRHVSPFSAAFNRAVQLVDADFFLQCDADMILAHHCVETLMGEMTPGTAVVVGLLDDPLQGAIRGIKLYRTCCCREFPVGSEIDCETAQLRKCLENGWESRRSDAVLGSHRLDLGDELYNFERFRLAGAKARQRRSWWDLTYRMIQLSRRVELDAAPLAAVALMAGLVSSEGVVHRRPSPSPEYLKWKRLESTGLAHDLQLERPFEDGWLAGSRRLHNGERLARLCLAQSSPAGWLYLAGYVAAVTDVQGRSPQRMWTQLAGWSDYLDEHFEAHLSGLRIWESSSNLVVPLV